jgi:hypothetical protein
MSNTNNRVTSAHIDSVIVKEFYFTAGDGVYGDAHKRGDFEVQAFPESLDLMTFCVLTLANGYMVTGESACASPGNFDEAKGRRIARENARQKIWQLEGYALRQPLVQNH